MFSYFHSRNYIYNTLLINLSQSVTEQQTIDNSTAPIEFLCAKLVYIKINLKYIAYDKGVPDYCKTHFIIFSSHYEAKLIKLFWQLVYAIVRLNKEIDI